jgi:regulator of replication initiation timing
MQQEQVIQQKQQAIDDLVKQVTELKKQAELAGIESRDLRQVNSTLKNKLEEVQESLKSNENLI